MEGEPHDMISTGEACRILHVHSNTLRRWAEQGLVKAYRIGTRGDRRFRRGDVYALLSPPLEESYMPGAYPPQAT